MYAFIIYIVYTCDQCRCNGKSENEISKFDEEKNPGVNILSMRGGDGHNSYASNSLLQVLSSYISFSNFCMTCIHKLIYHYIFYTPTS